MDMALFETFFISPFVSKNSSFFISLKNEFHSSEFGSLLIFKYSLYFLISSVEISFFIFKVFAFPLFLLFSFFSQATANNIVINAIKIHFFNFIISSPNLFFYK